jgi:hypothetical protein
MVLTWSKLSRSAAVALALCGASTSLRPANAAVLSPTPTLPVLGVPYIPNASSTCFAAAGVCVAQNSLTLTSVVSSTFTPGGQDIVVNAVFAGELTTLTHTPIGPYALFGTVEQLVEGRTFSTELGSWITDLVNLSVSGPVLGHTLTMALDPANASAGVSSITPLPIAHGEPVYRIDSFFDVFVELSLDSIPPLTTTVGPVRVTASVPEPATWAMLIVGAAALGLARRVARRRPAARTV